VIFRGDVFGIFQILGRKSNTPQFQTIFGIVSALCFSREGFVVKIAKKFAAKIAIKNCWRERALGAQQSSPKH